jgi:two-component system chemotaxis response regulator CheB
MELPLPVIALVSSAGGLDATTQVISGLPESLGACLIVLQHTSPDRESLLPRVLEHQTGRQVLPARHGSVLSPGSVLVAPSGCHTLVGHDRRITMIESGPFPPWRPSADLLLVTMAMALGPMAIAVVLSGEGHDGATGATAIHQRGGIVLTSDETSSPHFSMPRSTKERDAIAPPSLSLPGIVEWLPGIVRALGTDSVDGGRLTLEG